MNQYIITEELLNQIKNDCAFPERFGCDNGCKFWNIDEEIPCTWKGANALMDEVRSHPYNPQAERETISKELALELCMDARKDAREIVLDELNEWLSLMDEIAKQDIVIRKGWVEKENESIGRRIGLMQVKEKIERLRQEGKGGE